MELKLQNNPPKKCAGFLTEQMDGEIVLLHPARNIIIHINETAALVWQLCDGTNSMQQIIEILSTVYPDARVEIAKDVPDIIQKLQEQCALENG
jgi:coenzyme PQQ biosynthesis protein PqqD